MTYHKKYDKFNVGMMIFITIDIIALFAVNSFNICSFISFHNWFSFVKILIGIAGLIFLCAMDYHFWIYRIKE